MLEAKRVCERQHSTARRDRPKDERRAHGVASLEESKV